MVLDIIKLLVQQIRIYIHTYRFPVYKYKKFIVLECELNIFMKDGKVSIEEQMIFFGYCRSTFYDNLFNVAVNTGLRPGELFALQLSDIDLKNGFINVDKTLVYQKYLDDDRKTNVIKRLPYPRKGQNSRLNICS